MMNKFSGGDFLYSYRAYLGSPDTCEVYYVHYKDYGSPSHYIMTIVYSDMQGMEGHQFQDMCDEVDKYAVLFSLAHDYGHLFGKKQCVCDLVKLINLGCECGGS